MSMWRLIVRSLVYHRRMHSGLLLGTALACAILTGALLVGESVDHTLRSIALTRLGRVRFAMESPHRPFEEWLADNLRQCEPRLEVAALLRLPGMLAPPPERQNANRLNRVQVLGVDAPFFELAQHPASVELRPQQIAVNEKAASALGVQAGDDLVLRVMRQNRMPLDAPLANRKEEPAAVSLVTVAAVIADEQLGRFSLAANQAAPYNAFVDRAWLQELAGEAGMANLLLAGGEVGPNEAQRALELAWDLDHVGLRLTKHDSGILQLESDNVFIDEEAVRAASEIPGAQPTLTYLVNEIEHNGRYTPYSFVQAGSVPDDMPGDEAIICQWLADELGLAPGDLFNMTYLKLLPNNTFEERTEPFKVHSVVSMEQLAVERELAPNFPGLSDVESCSDWNIGMPMDNERLLDAANEAYWREYRQTPKLLVTYEAGRRMWGNQFGSVTAVRFRPPNNDPAEIEYRLRETIDPVKIGLQFMPVGEIAENAVNQSLDFGGLFLGMSFFLISAALILLGLLYVFGLQQRAPEFATLSALGFTQSRIRAIFLLESAPAALAGSVLGAAGGAAYAKLLIGGLERFWPAAVAGTPIAFHAAPGAMLAGAVAGLIAAMLVITVALWRASRRSTHHLLTADLASADPPRLNKLGLLPPTAALVPAVALSLNVWLTQPRSYVLHFFAAGALVLAALIGYGRWLLIRLDARQSFEQPTLAKLALVNLTRRRGRTLSVAGLTACGCFLVFAVSSMQENVALHAGSRTSGTGGFDIFAETTVPLLGTPEEVTERLGAPAVSLRVRDGDDAGCLNLNRAQLPKLYGVNPETMSQLNAFDPEIWNLLSLRSAIPNLHLSLRGGSGAQRNADEAIPVVSSQASGEPLLAVSPGMSLRGGAGAPTRQSRLYPAETSIPALVGDSDTAMWGLQKKTGDTIPYRDETGAEFKLQIAGTLPMRLSLFQGSLLVSDEAFTRVFPAEAGFRAFLIDVPGGDAAAIAHRLNRDFEKYGMQAVPAVQRLREFYSVESTYLAMFLVLGGLGLILGAGGVGVVVLRNGFERRAELALLHALGFERSTLFRMLLTENAALAAAGVGIGVLASAVAIVPIAVFSNTTVSLPLQAAILAAVTAANALAVLIATRLALPQNPTQNLREE